MERENVAGKGSILGSSTQQADPALRMLKCVAGVILIGFTLALRRWFRRGHGNAKNRGHIDGFDYRAPHGSGSKHSGPALMSTPFRPLPIGTVKADGWLATQLQMQVDGATGHAEELYVDLGPRSAWLGGDINLGNWAEISPYYVKGLVALAYVTGNPGLIAKAEKWISWTLENTGRDGFLGPPMLAHAGDGQDWWGRMPILYALRDYFDATRDDRVIPALMKWFRLMWETAPENPPTHWGRARIGDSIACVHWLYEQTREPWLLALSDYMEQVAYPWADIYTHNQFLKYDGGRDFQVKHNVNVQQCIKMPVLRSVRSNSGYHRKSFMIGTDHTMRQHGQVHGGISGSEMLSGDSSTTGVELCAIVERMQADQEAQMILGDASIGDHLEKLAFNALPGSISKDFTAHQYYTLPNQVQSTYGWHGCEQDNPTALTPSVASNFPCCRYDMHMGWPYYVKHMWAATADGGLAAMAYGPSHLTTRLGARRVPVSVKADTNYPFEEQVRLQFTMPLQVKFTLALRIPQWAQGPSILVNDTAQQSVISGSFHRINRTWSTGDTVTMNFPMSIRTSRWVRQSVAVERGPLVYSLKIDEDWLGPDPLTNGETLGSGVTLLPGYGTWQVKPNSPWRYALEIDPAKPEDSITVHQREMPNNPFVQSTTPVYLKARARAVRYWEMLRSNPVLAAEPPYPAVTSEKDVAITLVPFGAENIRLTYFPLAIPTENTTRAETGKFSGGTTVHSDAEMTFVDFNGNTGASIKLELISDKTGPHYMTLRYRSDCSNPWDNTTVVVNGTTLSRFTSTDVCTGAQWVDSPPLTVSLVEGANSVVITAHSTSAPQIESVSTSPLQGTSYQADEAVLSGHAIVNHDHPRYSGTGFVDYRRSTTASVAFPNVAARTDGEYKLVARYSAGDMDPRGVRVTVNGVPQKPITLLSTGSWGYWQDASPWIVPLKAGTNNTIEVFGSEPPFNLDSLAVVPL